MTEDQQEIYDEGKHAWYNSWELHENPYTGILAEYWSDGWEDAEEDSK